MNVGFSLSCKQWLGCLKLILCFITEDFQKRTREGGINIKICVFLAEIQAEGKGEAEVEQIINFKQP